MSGSYRFGIPLLLALLLVIDTRAQVPKCCKLNQGSCRAACEQISLVAIALHAKERQEHLDRLKTLCPSPQLQAAFWECINNTLREIRAGEGWIGRPCCHLPQSMNCRLMCLQVQSVDDLSSVCRQSDEISFYTCLERQEAGEVCCRNAQTPDCQAVCKEVFNSFTTPSRQVRNSIINKCTHHSPRVIQCISNYTHMSPAENPTRNLHCCDKSPNPECRSTCKMILHTHTTGQEIVDSLIQGGCGPPLPYNKLWQCFLANSDAVNNGPGIAQSEKVGMDSAKLQCCFRAATVNCQRLCIETFSNKWTQSWSDFDKLCQYQVAESKMLQCLIEVDEPCELGCEGLSYCTNFNYRPTELFRNCNPRADQAARNDVLLWEEGVIRLPIMTLPVLNVAHCHPEIWKAVACALQIKPCHQQSHINMICKSDCINLLSKCLDRRRLLDDQSATTICDILSPASNTTPCISLEPYLTKMKPSATEVSHPCKPNPCNSTDVCMLNRNCLVGQPCLPYICLPGCRMGEMSQVIVPKQSYIRVSTETYSPRCHKVCYCDQNGFLEDCKNQPCVVTESCNVDGKKIAHNSKFNQDCNVCYCFSGEISCTKSQCSSALPCHCPDHYVPVCGANGKTYPSACLARCAGLTDDQFEFGACFDSDPCSPNSCHPYNRCVPRKRVCLSIKHRSCKQYDCVNMQLNCNLQPKSPVCDTENVEHPNLCWMLQRRKTLAHHGKCMHHCRSSGPVCGHNGETYDSECAAWAERVSVDYIGVCVAVGSSFGSYSRCSGVKCPPFPSEHCTKVFPPGGCCPICGAGMRLLYSQKLVDWSVEAVREVEPVVLQTIAEKLRNRVKISECDVFAYLSLESDIVVLVTTNTDSPTPMQVAACNKEAEKLEALIQQGSPTLLIELPLSFIATASSIEPFTDSATKPKKETLLIILLTYILIYVTLRQHPS